MPRGTESIADLVVDEVECRVKSNLDREVDRVVKEIVEYLREQGYFVTANEILAKWRRDA